MRKTGLKMWLASMSVLLVVVPVTSALAQDSDDGDGTRRGQLESMAEGEDALGQDVTAMSAEDKLEQAQKIVNRNKQTLSDVQGRLQKAREGEQDIAKINCISEKVAAIKGFLKVSEQSYVELKNAVEEGDTESANHHYTLVAISGQKVGNLQQQAKACIGQVERYAEGTTVEVEADPSLDTQPEYLPGTTAELERLPELTPFQ